jgi:hypothetical protein
MAMAVALFVQAVMAAPSIDAAVAQEAVEPPASAQVTKGM